MKIKRTLSTWAKSLLIIVSLSLISILAEDKIGGSYTITAQIDPERNLIYSSARISFSRQLIKDEKEIYLKLGAPDSNDDETIHPQIERIADAEGTELSYETQGADKTLILHLASQNKSVNDITVEYSVPFSRNDLRNLGYYLYPSHDNSNYWYPVLLNENKQNIRFADYDVSLTFPKNYEVLTSGSRLTREQSAPGSIKTRFTAKHIEGFSLAFGENFELQEVVRNGIRVSAFSAPALSAKFLEIANQTADVAVWYQKTYGFFPTQNIGVVSGYKNASGGFPMPNLFMIHLGRLYSDFTRDTTAHELGHYYWGLYVLSSRETLDWLMLANGIWIDHVYLAEKTGQTLEAVWRGRDQELFNWFEFYRTAEIANYDQRLDIDQKEEDALNYDYHSFVRHAKGAVGVYLQAQLLGKEKFLALQKRILSEYRYRPFSPEDFVKLLTESGLSNAAEFFKVWEKGDAHLGYEIERIEKVDPSPGAFRYNIIVNRGGNVPYPLEVEVQDVKGMKNHLRFSGSQETEKIEVKLKSPFVAAKLDPDGILPIWNGANDEIQAVNIRAMFRAGISEPAIILATDYLKKYRADELTRSILSDELIKLRRFQTVRKMLAGRAKDLCNERSSCVLLINLAIALSEAGNIKEAIHLLDRIRKNSEIFGLDRRWQSLNANIRK